MAARTKICQTGTGATARVFRASNVMYTADNADVLGVREAEAANLKAPLYDTAELMRTGELVRINIRCSATGGRKINYRIFCAGDKIDDALSYYRATGKTLNGRTVVGAGLDRRQVVK